MLLAQGLDLALGVDRLLYLLHVQQLGVDLDELGGLGRLLQTLISFEHVLKKEHQCQNLVLA